MGFLPTVVSALFSPNPHDFLSLSLASKKGVKGQQNYVNFSQLSSAFCGLVKPAKNEWYEWTGAMQLRYGNEKD